jgi:tRNA pseudouridine13 synthase
MRHTTVPLVGPTTTFTDRRVEEAVNWALGKDKLTLEQLVVKDAPRLLYFKHEERPLLIQPQKLVVGRASKDEINRGFLKVNVAFTLPPGSYATLTVKRLFHFGVEQLEKEAAERPVRKDPLEVLTDPRLNKGARATEKPRHPNAAPEVRTPRVGFRDRQRLRKEARAAARASQPRK